MSDVLAKICDYKRKHIKKAKSFKSEAALMTEVTLSPPTRGFAVSISEKVRARKVALIAEVKKASPSKGVIREDFDPEDIAKQYYAAGASCISVLTDEKYFKGKDKYLTKVSNAVPLPILRKDFILDPYQVVESRAIGADCILLIMAALDDDNARDIEAAALSLGMDVLIEVHNEEELERALKLESTLIGINNRDLKTLEIDLSTTKKLSSRVPDDHLVVSESGISDYKNIKDMKKQGVYGFLVGESLMKEKDIKSATSKLLGKK